MWRPRRHEQCSNEERALVPPHRCRAGELPNRESFTPLEEFLGGIEEFPRSSEAGACTTCTQFRTHACGAPPLRHGISHLRSFTAVCSSGGGGFPKHRADRRLRPADAPPPRLRLARRRGRPATRTPDERFFGRQILLHGVRRAHRRRGLHGTRHAVLLRGAPRRAAAPLGPPVPVVELHRPVRPAPPPPAARPLQLERRPRRRRIDAEAAAVERRRDLALRPREPRAAIAQFDCLPPRAAAAVPVPSLSERLCAE